MQGHTVNKIRELGLAFAVDIYNWQKSYSATT